MVQLIVGKKGKGKTKDLLQKVNQHIKEATGNIVYLDKSSKHMYELNNKIRLIDVSRYPLKNSDEFIGFICGVISQDHDLQEMYLDSFFKISYSSEENISATIDELEHISEVFGVDFILSISLDKDELSDSLQSKVILAL